MKNILAFVGLLMLGGCVTPATQTQFQNSKVINRSEDAVWSDLIAFFTSHNVQLKTIERDSGVVYAERASFDPSMASCEKNAMVAPQVSSASLNVFVRGVSATQTQVTVNADFSQLGYYGATPIPLKCYSTGVLEAAILNALLGAGVSS